MNAARTPRVTCQYWAAPLPATEEGIRAELAACKRTVKWHVARAGMGGLWFRAEQCQDRADRLEASLEGRPFLAPFRLA